MTSPRASVRSDGASGESQAARVVVQGRARACDATRPTIGPRITAAGAAPAAAPLAMWPYDMRRTPPTCARAERGMRA